MNRSWALLLVLGPAALRAQSVAAGDSALARGDTTAAIRAYEAATAKNLHDAEAHYRAGVLWMTRHHVGDNVSPPRQKAEEHLRYAARFQPDSAKYLSALADVFKTSPDIPSVSQVSGLIIRAADAAKKHPSPATATMLYRAARVQFGRSGRAGSRPVTMDVRELDKERAYDDEDFVDKFLNERVRNDLDGVFTTTVHDAEEYARAALVAEPRYVAAGGLLALIMVDQRRSPEAISVTRHLVAAAPDSGRAWALLGMSLTRANKWGEAQAAFDTALARMTPAQRAPYGNLALLLTPGDSDAFTRLTARAQAHVDSLYWITRQPLFLTKLNEPRTEFYTRFTYAEHKYSDMSDAFRYNRYARPDLYWRYGPAERWPVLNPGGGPTVDFVWLYPHSRMRALYEALGGRSNRSMDLYREAAIVLPATFDNVPALYNLDTIDVQTAQFRGEDHRRTDIAVFSFMPVGRMARTAPHIELELNTAAIVKDSLMADVALERQDARLTGGDSLQMEHRTWRLNLEPRQYLLRVEALLAAIQRAASSQAALSVRSFAGDTLLMSDVVMAGRLAPRDSTPQRWTEFFLEPSSGRLDPQQPISLLWEIYNLVPDTAGVVRYHVELRVTVKEIERHGFLAELLGVLGDATGLSARGDDAVALGYNRAGNGRPGAARVEFITLNIHNAPNATYEVEVQITDQITKRVVSELRHLTVTPTPLRR